MRPASGVVALTEKLLDGESAAPTRAQDGDAENAAALSPVAALGEEQPATGDRAVLGGDAQFNFESTFRFMTQRRLQRRYGGVYQQYSFSAQLVTWIIVIYTLSVMATLAFGTSEIASTKESTTSSSVFIVAIILFAIYLFVRVALLIRWMVYWVVVAAMLVYAITGEFAAVFWLETDDTNTKQLSSTTKKVRDVIMIVLTVAELLTVAVYLFTHRTYPWLVLNNKFDTIKWWDVQRHARKSNTITYRSQARRLYTLKRNVITYCGGLDDQLRPHGFGMWTDTSFHGERLTGQWDHGIPIAPYRSFEHGSGYCFVNVRIGYCHVRSEDRPEQIYFMPKHASDGIHWGVGSVECSVSGGFFKFLPAVRHLTPHNGTGDNVPKSAADCELLLRSPTDEVTFQDQPETPKSRRRNTPAVNKRFPSARGLLFKENSCPILDKDVPDEEPKRSLAEGGKEALILLHGYNCSLNYSMNRLAQLLALGDFPTRIHPFVFSWPSGGALAYFQARDIGSQSDETAQAFRDFLRSLVDGGYTTIHIIAHSMGARVYFHSLKKGYLDEVFERDGDDRFTTNQATSGRRARLATLTFTNADYERNEFVKRGGSYDKSRRFCHCITVYADNMDGALFYSEIFSKETVLGPLNYSLGKRGHMLHRDPGDNDDTGSDSAHTGDGRNLHNLTPAEMDLAVAQVNQRGHYDGVASFAFNHPLRGEHLSTESGRCRVSSASVALEDDKPLEYLDLDVIDTTWMDNNVHSIRHNYFNLNPTVVEDLRCLVVEQQRASSRPGLLKTSDNVYIFLVAPSHVKNK